MAHLKSPFAKPFPVLPFTFRGRVLVGILKGFFAVLSIFFGKKWRQPLPDFEENPRNSPYAGATYLGYKYYFRPPLQAHDGLESHFRKQDLRFNPPENFISEKKLTLSAGGDLLPYDRLTPDSTRHLWDEVGDFFFNSDVVVANLETPLFEGQPPGAVPEVMLDDMHFNGTPEQFRIFSGNGAYRGFDVLSTANNHALDQGEAGVFSTLDFLKNKRIMASGTVRSEWERREVPMLERNGIRLAFPAWTYSLNKFIPPHDKPWLVNHERLNQANASLDRVLNDLRLAREQGADFTVLLLHTGNAYQAFPSAHTVEIYHQIFEQSGVDVILGAHPHNPQPMEKYEFTDPRSGQKKAGFAIYSLGDFVAYDIFVWGRLVPLLRLTVEKGIQDGRSQTLLTGVEVLPVYHWGSKTGVESRFLDLRKTVATLENGKRPPYLSDLCIRELRHLDWFCNACFLPEKADYLLASTD